MTQLFPAWAVCFLFPSAFVSTEKRGSKRVQLRANIEENVFPKEETKRTVFPHFVSSRGAR